MNKELVNFKLDGSFEPILKKYSDKLFISKPQLIRLLIVLMLEGQISEEQMKSRLMKGL